MRISKLNVFKNVCCMSCIYIFLYVIQCYFQSHAATTHILHHRQVHVNLNFPEVSKWKRPMWDTWFYTQHHNYDYKLGTSNQLLDGFGMKYLAYAQSNHSENWVSIFLPHMRSDKKPSIDFWRSSNIGRNLGLTPLWACEALAAPLIARFRHHFCRTESELCRMDKPEWAFRNLGSFWDCVVECWFLSVVECCWLWLWLWLLFFFLSSFWRCPRSFRFYRCTWSQIYFGSGQFCWDDDEVYITSQCWTNEFYHKTCAWFCQLILIELGQTDHAADGFAWCKGLEFLGLMGFYRVCIVLVLVLYLNIDMYNYTIV